MELQLINRELKAYFLIDEFESLIWRDRWAGHGDFELVLKETNYLLSSLKNYDFLSFSESNRLMMIETMEIPKQAAGKNQIKLTGRSVEAFLQYRTNSSPGTDILPLTGSISEMAGAILDTYVVNPTNVDNKIPGLEISYLAPGPHTAYDTKRGSIYDAISDVCKKGDVGWRIVFQKPDKLLFNVSGGIDLSNPSSTFYREFSQDNGTITNASYLQSIANYKTHVRVEGARTVVDVYPELTEGIPPFSGFNRRTVVVKATDVGTDEEIPIANDIPILQARGEEALTDITNQYLAVVDAEVPRIRWEEMSYGIGDLVRIRDLYGNKPKVRITENVWSVDNTGAKQIPTFTAVKEGTIA